MSVEVEELKQRIRDLEEHQAHLIQKVKIGGLPIAPADPDGAGIHIRIFTERAILNDQSQKLEGSSNSHEAFARAMFLIGDLRASGRKASNAPVREYSEEHYGEIITKLTEAIRNLGSIASRMSSRNPFSRDEPTPETWRDPKMDWRLVGAVPEKQAETADAAFRKLCTAVGELRDLGARSDSGDAVRFDSTAFKVGISVIAAAAQELAQFAMPNAQFDDRSKTMTEHVAAVVSARRELRKDL